MRVVAAAHPVDHTGAVRVVETAGAVHHVVGDGLVQERLSGFVGDLGADQGIKVCDGLGLVFIVEDDEEMGMG